MSRHGRFTPAADLLRQKIRELGEARGFSTTRLLTHWPEIVGESVAAIARPLEVRHSRGKKPEEGATLTILALGAAALRLEMEKERLRERVNACYGYNAITKIRIKQAGPESFVSDEPPAPVRPSPVPQGTIQPLANGVSDSELRLALAALAANVLSRSRP
ncbi:DUF721 domain-containing protein [Rubellimicrobium aerolatum]|uniref:DUF721 domain-containing protein n=1 Tax=Rubellimicrobium aerolatum TaxID=490979 RepID=A0ABW0SAK3_9RHOB|nr:hypothetical protein [Rubellimicrobium aerolatum]